MPTPIYPSWNDKEYDLLKKMTENTALIADYEIGDVASVAGTAGNVLVNGGTAAATGNITLSLPTALTSITSINGTAIPSSKTLVVTTDKISVLAATTSSELAGVISDETGTGSLVFANTPTLVTPNIGAATGTSVNLSGAGTFGGNLTVSGGTVGTAASTDLTLAGGSSGASLVLGQGANGAISATLPGTGLATITGTIQATDSAGTGAGVLRVRNNTTTTTSAPSWVLGINRQNSGIGALYLGVDANNDAIISTGNGNLRVGREQGGTFTEIARFTNTTQNVLIGGTTDITGSGGLKVFGTTASSSTTTGALQVAGGIGVAGAGYFGGGLTTSQGSSDSVVALANTAQRWEWRTRNAERDIRLFDGTNSSYLITVDQASSANNGLITLSNQFRSGVAVAATTASTSTTTGALVVSGGVGVAGAANVGGNLTVSGGTVTSGTGTLTLNSSANTVVLQSAGTTALTLDASQNATFAGTVFINKTIPLLELKESGTTTAQIYTASGNLVVSTNQEKTISFAIGITGTVLSLSPSTKVSTFSGPIKLANAYQAGAPTATGYVTIQDSTGTTYKVLVGT